MARILITGGSGLLATNWASQLCKEHLIYLGINRRKILLPGVKIVDLDLTSTFEIVKTINLYRIELIIHAAAITNVEECEENPVFANYVNVNFSENIAIASSLRGVKLVYISTDHLFDDSKIMFSEADIAKPMNTYAKTKAEAEKKVIENNSGSLIIRTNFYGWGVPYRHSFSDNILKALINGSNLYLFNDVFYTPILINTLVDCVQRLIKLGESGIFNVVGDERLSKFEFGKKLALEFNLDPSFIIPISINSRKDLVNRPREMGLSNQKLCNVIGEKIGDVGMELSKLRKQKKPQVCEIGNFNRE